MLKENKIILRINIALLTLIFAMATSAVADNHDYASVPCLVDCEDDEEQSSDDEEQSSDNDESSSSDPEVPKDQAPVAQAPVAQAPVAEAPVDEAPEDDAAQAQDKKDSDSVEAIVVLGLLGALFINQESMEFSFIRTEKHGNVGFLSFDIPIQLNDSNSKLFFNGGTVIDLNNSGYSNSEIGLTFEYKF